MLSTNGLRNCLQAVLVLQNDITVRAIMEKRMATLTETQVRRRGASVGHRGREGFGGMRCTGRVAIRDQGHGADDCTQHAAKMQLACCCKCTGWP